MDMDHEFPFAVPEDLSTATDEELSTLRARVREYAETFSASSANDGLVAALTACRDLVTSINSALALRETSRSLASDIDALTTPPEPNTDDDAAQGGEAPVTAAGATRPPTVRDVAARSGTPDLPPDTTRTTATMHAATDVPGRFSTGQRLNTFDEAVQALAHQVGRYPRPRDLSHGSAIRRPSFKAGTVVLGDDGSARYEMRHFDRHGGVEFRREFPRELIVRSGITDGYSVAKFASSESRLPGGSLLESFRQSVNAGTPLTGAAGWCAVSDPILNLCGLSSLDGILPVPELVTEHGGWQIPTGGGPDFSTVWSGIGNAGTTHLTEAQVIADSTKYCFDIPCPGYTDVRLGVDYFCLTGSLLQQRGYPGVVQWFGEQAMIALPHKINMGFIAAMVTAAGASNVIPVDATCDDAISAFLSGLDLAITDAKYRFRYQFNGTLEVVAPMWILAQLRAAATRRSGTDMTSVADAQIMQWFTERKAVPHFVYDWQDAYSGLATGPGGAAPLTALPLTADFLIYPAGAWVKAVQPVVSLDTVYDSTKLGTNEYTAMFVEDGWAALQMCPLTRLYTTSVDPGCLCVCSHS